MPTDAITSRLDGAPPADHSSTPSRVVIDIRRHHELAQANATAAVDHARQAGALLLEAKASLGHGQWLPWLKEHFDFTERTAQRYMRATAPRVLPAKCDRLSYSDSLRNSMFKQHREKRRRERYRDEVCGHCSFVLAELDVVREELRPKDKEMLKALRARIDDCLSAASRKAAAGKAGTGEATDV